MTIKKNYSTLSDAIEAAGLGVHEPICDGVIHRFQTPSSSYGKENGWYVSRGDGGYAFGDWSTGLKVTRRRGRMSTSEKVALKERVKQSAAEKLADQEDTKETAQAIWNMAKVATDHPYLHAKGILPHGIKTMNNLLLVPMYHRNELVNLQRIYPDGKKWFLPGGLVKGCYFTFGEQNGHALIAEGFATGASLHEYTKEPVIISFTAGNMMEVGRKYSAENPDDQIIVMADNDKATEIKTGKNPGIEAGSKLAAAIGARMMSPDFDDKPFEGTDFNDYLTQGGTL